MRRLMSLNASSREGKDIIRGTTSAGDAALTFLVVDLPFLLPRVVGRDLEQALDIPEQGLRTRDRGILAPL